MKVRYESFGGIIRIEDPPATIYVDKDYMKNLGYKQSDLWSKESDVLSAPIDAHFALTNKCPLECKHCYKSSTGKEQKELTLSQIKEILDILAKMNVFSVAFGGGEPFAREEIFEIAKYANEKGIIPNITTNGYYITEETAKKCKVFGHMHVSLDLPTDDFDDTKNTGAFEAATNAIDLLNKEKIHIGINCVVSSANFDQLEDLVKYCISKKIRDMTFLRFKPIGRAGKRYHEMKLTNEQNIKLFPLLRKFRRKYRIFTQVDCSLTPMACYHKPKVKMLDFFGAQGCEGGNTFIEIKEDGAIRGCSFATSYGDNAKNLDEIWYESSYLTKYREVTENINEPCISCKYLPICRGGCHIVSEFLTGDFNNPDPECPLVIKYNERMK
jgi:radical SAM protein with 4Fe4S-binding SPASM domain